MMSRTRPWVVVAVRQAKYLVVLVFQEAERIELDEDFKEDLILPEKNSIVTKMNVNSTRNKFEFLSAQRKGNIDILMVSETTIDNSFQVGNFVADEFSTPCRLDHDNYGRGIILYSREDIPSKLYATDEKNQIESFYVELNLHNEKSIINCSYNPNKTIICNHLDALSTYLNLHSTTYEKI